MSYRLAWIYENNERLNLAVGTLRRLCEAIDDHPEYAAQGFPTGIPGNQAKRLEIALETEPCTALPASQSFWMNYKMWGSGSRKKITDSLCEMPEFRQDMSW